MPLVPSKKYITVECKENKHKLTVDEYTRWLCFKLKSFSGDKI